MRACSRLRKNSRNGGSKAAQSAPSLQDGESRASWSALWRYSLGGSRVVIPIDVKSSQLPLMLHRFNPIGHQQILITKGPVETAQFQKEICIGEQDVIFKESDVIKRFTSIFSGSTNLEQHPLRFKTEQSRVIRMAGLLQIQTFTIAQPIEHVAIATNADANINSARPHHQHHQHAACDGLANQPAGRRGDEAEGSSAEVHQFAAWGQLPENRGVHRQPCSSERRRTADASNSPTPLQRTENRLQSMTSQSPVTPTPQPSEPATPLTAWLSRIRISPFSVPGMLLLVYAGLMIGLTQVADSWIVALAITPLVFALLLTLGCLIAYRKDFYA